MTNLKGVSPLLQVHDMSVALEFYLKLGFEVIDSAPSLEQCEWCLLRVNDVELMLNTIFEKDERPLEREILRNAYHGDVIIYFGCPDVLDLYHDLTARGVDVQPPQVTGYGFDALNITDPDGYHLCFHWPTQSV